MNNNYTNYTNKDDTLRGITLKDLYDRNKSIINDENLHFSTHEKQNIKKYYGSGPSRNINYYESYPFGNNYYKTYDKYETPEGQQVGLNRYIKYKSDTPVGQQVGANRYSNYKYGTSEGQQVGLIRYTKYKSNNKSDMKDTAYPNKEKQLKKGNGILFKFNEDKYDLNIATNNKYRWIFIKYNLKHNINKKPNIIFAVYPNCNISNKDTVYIENMKIYSILSQYRFPLYRGNKITFIKKHLPKTRELCYWDNIIDSLSDKLSPQLELVDYLTGDIYTKYQKYQFKMEEKDDIIVFISCDINNMSAYQIASKIFDKDIFEKIEPYLSPFILHLNK